jgi:hypothetical protein
MQTCADSSRCCGCQLKTLLIPFSWMSSVKSPPIMTSPESWPPLRSSGSTAGRKPGTARRLRSAPPPSYTQRRKKILFEVAHGGTAQQSVPDNTPEVALDQGNPRAFHGDIGAGAHGDTDVGLRQSRCIVEIMRGPQCCLLRRNSFFDSEISIMTRAPTAQIPSSAGRSGVVRNTVLKNGT